LAVSVLAKGTPSRRRRVIDCHRVKSCRSAVRRRRACNPDRCERQRVRRQFVSEDSRANVVGRSDAVRTEDDGLASPAGLLLTVGTSSQLKPKLVLDYQSLLDPSAERDGQVAEVQLLRSPSREPASPYRRQDLVPRDRRRPRRPVRDRAGLRKGRGGRCAVHVVDPCVSHGGSSEGPEPAGAPCAGWEKQVMWPR
jgi:hypothetical protein